MRSLLSILVTTVAGVSVAVAELPEEIKKCRAIKDAVQRLECFDKAAEPTPPPAKADEAPGDAGKWETIRRTSKIDDSQEVYLILQATEPVRSRANFRNQHATLVVRCSGQKTGLYVNMETFIGTEGTSVTYRLDKEAAKREWWQVSNDKKAVGTWEGPRTIPLIRDMLGKSEFVFSLTPYSENTVIVTLPIAGLENAIKPVQEACKWPAPAQTKAAQQGALAARAAAEKRAKETRNCGELVRRWPQHYTPEKLREIGCR